MTTVGGAVTCRFRARVRWAKPEVLAQRGW